MSLPFTQTLEDCASFDKTVAPYLVELRNTVWPVSASTLTERLRAFIDEQIRFRTGNTDLLHILFDTYVETNPLVSGFVASVALGFVFWVVSVYNRNYSQVDRCWSLLPTFYIGHFALWARLAGLPSQRLDLVLLFSTIWSIRLTYNYARKGGYNVGSQDYRWEIVRKAIPGWLFQVFNLTFIAFFQSILLFLLAAPAYCILLASNIEQAVTPADWGFVAVELGLVLVEWFSDQQQWNYQTAKQLYQRTARLPVASSGGRPAFSQESLDRGFVAEGLWAFSRHPNFAAEQSVWIVLYQWSCYACNGVLYSWAGLGVAILVMLFQGSTWLTEQITAGKYPEYKDYQARVGMFVPTSLTAYSSLPSPPKSKKQQPPKIIRTSELAKTHAVKAASAKASGSEPLEGTAAKR